MSRPNAVVALLLAAVVWGLAFIFQKSAMDHVGPLAFIAARGVVASLALLPFALREHRHARAMGETGLTTIGVLGGVAFFIAAWLQQTGIRTATVTNTGFLTALYVVITPFVAWGWRGKPPVAVAWIGVVLSTGGIWLLGGGTLAALERGDWLVAASAFFWAAHVVITGRAATFGRPMAFTTITFAVAAALATVFSISLEVTTVSGLAGAALDIAYVGLLSSALAFSLLTVALQHIPPAEAVVIASMETVFAALAAGLILGERLLPIGWLGAALILAAALLVQLAPSSFHAPKTSGPAGRS